MIVASITTASARPGPNILMNVTPLVTNARNVNSQQGRRGGDDAAGASRPRRDRVRVVTGCGCTPP